MKNLMRVSKGNEYEWTNNRGVYNRHRKMKLEQNGEIRCSYCPYNRVENWKGRHYGGYDMRYVTHPNWKLVSNNKKQYLPRPKGFKTVERDVRSGGTYVTFRWNSKRHVK